MITLGALAAAALVFGVWWARRWWRRRQEARQEAEL